MVEGVRFNAGKTRPRRSNVLCFNGKGEKLGLDKPVVSAFKLRLQHFGVLGSDTVKVVILMGENTLVGRATHVSLHRAAGNHGCLLLTGYSNTFLSFFFWVFPFSFDNRPYLLI